MKDAVSFRVRKTSIYDKKSNTPFKISRSKFFNFLSCKRCFYLDIIKENRNFKIIKHTFNLPNKNRITKEIGIGLSQIQFCVSSNDNICDITIKEENKRILKAKKRLIIG